MNKKLLITCSFILAATLGMAQSSSHEHTAAKTDSLNKAKKSIPQEEHAQIGNTHITILYTAPTVRGRIIWGGLVPYGDVWVTGAHRATSMEVDHEFIIAGKKVPPGKYAIFTIPGKEKWIFILNRNWDQHLADDYNEKDDVLRLEVTPRSLAETQERLNYAITELSETEAVLSISWERIKLNIPLKLNIN